MIVSSLTACRGRNQPVQIESAVGGVEALEAGASSPSEPEIDGMTMQELFLLRKSLYTNELIDKIDQRIIDLQQENYFYTADDTTANILNIVNIFQFRELIYHQEAMDSLAMNNYALLPDSLPQLFQVYQRNDSLKIPNFVTVDLMAQLSHVYEGYVLRTVEEKHFAPMLADLCLALYNASVQQANRTTREDIKNMAAYHAAFFAVPYALLTGKTLKTQGDYPAIVEIELAYIDQHESRRPALLDIKTNFDYSVFRPYGHYTRTVGLRRYFKAWKWLQLAPYCSDNRLQMQRAVFAAFALQTARTESGESAIDVYAHLTEAMNWLIGQPAAASILDVALLMQKERITTITAALDARFLAKVTAMIGGVNAGNNPVVNYPAVCRNGIYFIPQPAYMDEGSDASSYSKRIEGVPAMLQKTDNSPVFAQKQAWKRKMNETSLALRLKMKHNVLLYGVVPDYPEPIANALPKDANTPPVKGYVEPALPFWTNLREWVELMDANLKNYRLINDTLSYFSARMHRYVALMEDAVLKESNGESLSDETYRFIAEIGDSIQQFTLAMIEPQIDRWDWAAGTDKSVAVFEKTHQRNTAGNPSNDVLYAATGNPYNIYVIVEIDGYLYLAKGATFSYHEFTMPHDTELKDEEWQEMKRKLFFR